MEWFNNRDYWSTARSYIWSETRIENSGAAAEAVVKLLGASQGESILDMACGFGRHTFHFERLGLKATGVDLNPDFINEAVSRAGASGSSVCFIRDDMRKFIRRDSFHHVAVLYNSFGYFEDPDDDRKVLSNCFTSLHSGGKLLISTTSKDSTARFSQSGNNRYWMEDKDGGFVLMEAVYDPETSIVENRWILHGSGERKEFAYSLRVYSRPEMETLLSQAGFENINCYSGLSGKPFDEDNSHSLVVTCIKR